MTKFSKQEVLSKKSIEDSIAVLETLISHEKRVYERYKLEKDKAKMLITIKLIKKYKRSLRYYKNELKFMPLDK